MTISPEVRRALQDARTELLPLLRQLDIQLVSKHNMGLMKYAEDPAAFFIDAEMNRFLHTTNFIYTRLPKAARVLDIGVFIPVVPIALSKLGYKVEAIEKLALYGNSLDTILQFIDTVYDIRVHDIDIISGDVTHLAGRFDVVLLLAILEHLNGSPKGLLGKCRILLNAGGSLVVEVPNMASIARRISFLITGKSPLPEYSEYFSSDYPFGGHNREYNLSELKYALRSAGFEIQETEYLNLRLHPGAKLRSRLLRTFSILGFPSWRDVIWTVAQSKPGV